MNSSLATAPEIEPHPDLCVVDAAAPKRILLIEDDAEFRETIREFLAGCGYAVVMAENGVEGVKELLVGEFEVILCDVNMPKLPGDMFYRAVQGIKPLLCARFIFMTGYRGNDKINDFIRHVSGTVLTKPFRMARLEETITRILTAPEAEVSIPSPHPTTHAPLTRLAPAPAPTQPAVAAPAPPVPARTESLYFARHMDSPAVRGLPLPAAERQEVWTARRGRSKHLALAALALCVATAAVLGFWAASLQARVVVAEGHLHYEQSEWAAVSPQLQEAELARLRLQSLIELPKRVTADRDLPRWMPALQGAVTKAGSAIQFHMISARGSAKHPGACDLTMQGFATGSSPRALAEQLRESLQAGLDQRSQAAAKLRFRLLEDDPKPPSEPPEKQRVRFTITGAVETPEPPKENIPAK